MEDTTIILLAAGKGTRVGLDYNKLLEKVYGKYVFEYTLDTFSRFNLSIILVVSNEDYDFFLPYQNKQIKLVKGGVTRNESVINALREVKTKRVLIHDVARALVSEEIIKKCLESKSSAYFVCIPLKDTIRDNHNKTLDRAALVSVQTPQGGDTKLFLEYEKYSSTDDISSFDNTNIDIERILGDDYNFKITTKFDLEMFKHIVRYNNDKNR